MVKLLIFSIAIITIFVILFKIADIQKNIINLETKIENLEKKQMDMPQRKIGGLK